MNTNTVEAVQGTVQEIVQENNKEKSEAFPVDLLIHFADEAWASLNRSAAMRNEDPEVALSVAIGLLEQIEIYKQKKIELYRKLGNEYELVVFR
jgi:hypothetical protein